MNIQSDITMTLFYCIIDFFFFFLILNLEVIGPGTHSYIFMKIKI